MNFLNFLRWIFFIPLGLVASALASTLATIFVKFIGKAGAFGGASWYMWLVNGLVAAYSLAWVSFYIVPKITRFCKWIVVGLMLVMGISTFIVVPTANIERVEMISGIPITIMGFVVASWSPEEIERNLELHNKKQG
jgi:hypothetical protein